MSQYNAIAIDPGINHLGLCLSTFSNNEIVETTVKTIHVKEKLLDKKDIEKYGLRQCKIDYLNKELCLYIETYKPTFFILESPFFNMRRPAAFLPLVQLLYQFYITLRQEMPDCIYLTYPPSIIKKTLGASAICKKQEVKEYVSKIESFYKLSKDIILDELDEHSIDALGVLYTFCQKDKDQLSENIH